MDSLSTKNFMPVVDYLTYKSYEFNRLNNPDITPDRWLAIYPNGSVYEKLFNQNHKEPKIYGKQSNSDL